jgi:hypothetical protein
MMFVQPRPVPSPRLPQYQPMPNSHFGSMIGRLQNSRTCGSCGKH